MRAGRVKKGREETNSAAKQGRSHRSRGVREVGWKGQEKRCWVVWAAPLQEGQLSSGLLPTLIWKDLRDEQNPDLSWERLERYGRGRVASSSAMGGGGVRRTLLGDWRSIAEDTAEVWRAAIVDL